MSKQVNKYTILIVDDEPNIVMTLDFLMRKNGYEVLIARDGAEAIELYDKHHPGIVLLDIMMPNVNGYEVCKYIKSEESSGSSKVIFLSAKGKEEDIKKGYEMGADLYLSKPFSTRELVKKVKAFSHESIN